MPIEEDNIEPSSQDQPVADAASSHDAANSPSPEQSAADTGLTDNDPAPSGDKPKETMLDQVSRILGLKKDKDAAPTDPAAAKDDGAAASAAGVAAKDQPQDDGGAESKDPAQKQDAAAPDVPKEIAEHPAYVRLQEENKQYKTAHESMTKIQEFMQQNGLQSQDMSAAMNVAAQRRASGIPAEEYQRADALTQLAYADPQKFYDTLVTMAEEYGVALGKRLPSDLQKKVDDGLMDEADARELSQARINEKIATQKAERLAKTSDADRSAANASQSNDLVNRWFERAAQADPELSYKVNAIEGELYRLVALRERDGKPVGQDQKAILALLDEAHKNVTENMRLGKPRQPVNPAPRSEPRPAGDSQKEKTPEEKKIDNVLAIMNRSAG